MSSADYAFGAGQLENPKLLNMSNLFQHIDSIPQSRHLSYLSTCKRL
jgi:hypothetical protein